MKNILISLKTLHNIRAAKCTVIWIKNTKVEYVFFCFFLFFIKMACRHMVIFRSVICWGAKKITKILFASHPRFRKISNIF